MVRVEAIRTWDFAGEHLTSIEEELLTLKITFKILILKVTHAHGRELGNHIRL